MDLNQITLEVDSLDRAIAFYETLGLRCIVLNPGRYARFECPSGATTLSIHPADPPRIGATVLYFEVEDVDRRHAELTAKGIHFESAPIDTAWRWREARFSDPAGNRLCLFHAGPDRRFPPWRLAPRA
ncbi:MAG: VOC family protein [Pseudomonadota bacterium]